MLITNCILCQIEGVDLGKLPVYNKYTKEDPTGVSYGVKRYYTITQCPKCKLFWVKDIGDEYEQMYVQDYWQEHMEMRGWPRIETEERINNDVKYAKLRMPDIKRFVSGGNALDIACSTGTMLKEYKEGGFGPDVHGVEVNLGAVKQAQEYSGCFVYDKALTGSEPEIPNAHYDFVSALDVFEHMRDPLGQAKIWSDKVKRGGILWIECPDAGCTNCTQNPLAKEKGVPSEILWNDYVIPYEHTYYYRQQHVIDIFTNLGCVCLESCNQWTSDRMRVVFRKVF